MPPCCGIGTDKLLDNFGSTLKSLPPGRTSHLISRRVEELLGLQTCEELGNLCQ